MAYAVLSSLWQTIFRLLKSPKISVYHEILEPAYGDVGSLRDLLGIIQDSINDSSSSEGVVSNNMSLLDAFSEVIRDAAWKLEDALESYESLGDDLDLEAVLKQEIDSLKETAKKMKDEYDRITQKEEELEMEMENDYSRTEIIRFFTEERESRDPMPEKDDDDAVDFGGNESKNMVGFSDEFRKIKDMLLDTDREPGFIVVSLVGVIGIGKTTLARKLLEDESIRGCFNHCAFVTVGPKNQMKEIMLAILSQLNYDITGQGKTIEQVGVALGQSLFETKYLIVLDDVRYKKCWDELQQCFPDHNNGSRVLVTTRLIEVADYSAPSRVHQLSPLDMDKNWILFCEQVFGQHQLRTPQLENIGEHIAYNCGGLPLTIMAFARLLSKTEKNVEYWTRVAMRVNSFFMDAYDEMFKVPLPSYYNKFHISEECNNNKNGLGLSKSKNMIGLDDQFSEIKNLLIDRKSLPFLHIIPLVGMAGIGKTTLAGKLFEDESIRNCFDLRAFVTVGPQYQINKIRLAILSQICGLQHEELEHVEAIALHRFLKGRRYLIVLDDVWNKGFCDQLYLPDGPSGSRVLMTTRILEVAKRVALEYRIHSMRFLNEKESLHLLRERVFGEDQLFPDYQIQKAAEKIVETCQGLPLAIIAVADLLSQDKTLPHWNEVAEIGHLVFKDIGDDMSEVLSKSYNYLPQKLKACFLYMGVFPPNCEIPASKLIKLWIAEGFLGMHFVKRIIENVARKFLDDLALKSDLILVRKQSFYYYRTKTCSLHFVYWYLCNKEAQKEKFLHVMSTCADIEGIEEHRRLCIHNNVIFGIKEVHCSMESDTSTVRSLLCTGPYHQYPLPRLSSQWKLLRVLDALTIRFYNFPFEVLELIQLRYLALTYNGKIPASISKLWHLQYLIVQRHMSIISSQAPTYLPIEIWNMKELRCLQVMESDLPPPDHGAALNLPNLLTLSYVSANSCTKEILEKTPHLNKLGIQIKLTPSDNAVDNHPYHCFEDLYVLLQLKFLKCAVVNPNPNSRVVAFPASFPSTLKKLSLSGLGYPWEYMSTIAQLPNLEVLKLQCYAFRGPEWEIGGNEFQTLEALLIEDTDLKYWRTVKGCFPQLVRLVIGHCYKLQEIPADILQGNYLKTLEVVDCPLALNSIKKKSDKNGRLHVGVKSSWDKKTKS